MSNIRGKSTQGKFIVSLQDGEQIGKLKELILDPEKYTIVALLIESKNIFKEKMVILYDQVHNIDEVITVKNSNSLEKATVNPHINKLLKQKTNIYGTQIITEDGSILGIVEDFLFDIGTGEIISIQISDKIYQKILKGNSELPITYVLTVGNDAVIVKADSKEAMLTPDDSLSEKVESLKESSTKLWNTTKGSTAKLSKQFSKSLKILTSQKKVRDDEEDQVNDEPEKINNSDNPNKPIT